MKYSTEYSPHSREATFTSESLAVSRSSAVIPVAMPTLPDLDDALPLFRQAWSDAVVTNAGPLHDRLELAITDLIGAPCALTSTGTAALELSLGALEAAAGMEVVLPAFTFPATIQAVVRAGLRPVYADIDPVFLDLCPKHAASVITQSTACILPVHLFGNPGPIDAYQRLADQFGLRLVHDAAATFGAEYRDQPVGPHGSATAFSFHATKAFTTVEGGAVVSADEALIERVRSLRNFGMHDGRGPLQAGTNAKMSELHAAVGLAGLATLPSSISRRRELAARYWQGLAEVRQVRVLGTRPECRSNATNMVIVFESAGGADLPVVDVVARALRGSGISTRRYFDSRYLPADLDLRTLPITNLVARSTLCLPLFPTLTEAEVDRICAIVRSELDTHNAA